MTDKTIKIATRKSPLAMAQTHSVITQLLSLYPKYNIIPVPLSSLGDDDIDRPLHQFSDVGVFVKKIEKAILKGEADCALHCLKDLPAPLDSKFVLPCYLPREDVHDVILFSKNMELSDIREVATGSLRRKIFLGRHYPNWQFLELRGNINTRIDKVIRGEIESIVLAQVGINRLKAYQGGDEQKIFREYLNQIQVIPFPTEILLPAPSQGILVLQCRANDTEMVSLLRPLNHEITEMVATVEREVMMFVEGGCRTPLGVWTYLITSTSSPKISLNSSFLESKTIVTEATMARNNQIVSCKVSDKVNKIDEEKKLARKVANKLLKNFT